MTNMQILALVLATVTIVGMLAATPLIRKLARNRKFVFVASFVILALLIGLRYGPTVHYGILGLYSTPKWQSIFLTDICPMFSFVIVACLLTNNWWMAQSVAPIALLGGLLVLYGQFAFAGEQQPDLLRAVFYDYLSSSTGVGIPNIHNFGYFFTHWALLLMSLFALLGSTRRTWRHFAAGGLTISVYYAYVGIVMASFGLYYNVSGLDYHDWTTPAQNGWAYGEYSVLQGFFFEDWKATAATAVMVCVAGYTLICVLNTVHIRMTLERKRFAAQRSAYRAAVAA